MFKDCTSLSTLQFYDFDGNEATVVETDTEGVYTITFPTTISTSGNVIALAKNKFSTTVKAIEDYAFYNCSSLIDSFTVCLKVDLLLFVYKLSFDFGMYE